MARHTPEISISHFKINHYFSEILMLWVFRTGFCRASIS